MADSNKTKNENTILSLRYLLTQDSKSCIKADKMSQVLLHHIP